MRKATAKSKPPANTKMGPTPTAHHKEEPSLSHKKDPLQSPQSTSHLSFFCFDARIADGLGVHKSLPEQIMFPKHSVSGDDLPGRQGGS